MADFRTFSTAKRSFAVPLQPVVDPAGWLPQDMADIDAWSYRLTDDDQAQVLEAVEAQRRMGTAVAQTGVESFRLQGGFASVMTDVREELRNGRGIVMLRNFPVRQMDREATAIAYLGVGSYLGRPMSQNMQGHILGHVKDLGGDYADPNTRGYFTRAEMRCHSDPCDYVGLLCLQTAKAGGASRVASSVSVYNTLLQRRPDLAEVLIQDFYRSRKGDVNPGEPAWFKQPIFTFHEGRFSAVGAGSSIDKAQGLPGVPPWSAEQQEAIALYREIAEELLLDIPFQPGDIQFLNNYVALHTRRDYQDWPEPERKRHLLRLWLYDPDNRPIPPEQRHGFRGRGVLPAGVQLNAPLDVRETA
ncbi:TauD/TfdA family dioxygenase [Pusillimonas noertemannii]|uniref:TfdA family taurine catabolism dioxygenase TauD n=1 Tax=Pusillimonas noertemannii TaxID=305977 RepID=A0A2U1CQF6_9BURK|nr:TauD/TfdA family dioxygenase [Pusillimonas noertemannii]NYT67457.1 TauD/TfdA family dioxygenase [Pusillimonas noertemannii]PVY68130.1 TfdA family taurine catabolism dioxygenase TauD [Pusillimonas noertemannii]TFL12369.1 TauD/TfdA family dioxygenase [Pusillimonas noertemannii]